MSTEFSGCPAGEKYVDRFTGLGKYEIGRN
jgi:hypothetical protein